MGNKQGHELTPEEKQRLKDEKEREKRLLKEEKDRKRREKKDEKRRKKLKKKGGADVLGDDEGSDSQSVGSSQWSEKSQGSAPGSWYHSASEPSSKRSSIYMPASAGPGYYQHDCWYSGYEDSGSEKSKPPSRAGSVKDHTVMGLRAGSLERYPLGVPTGEPIEPIHRGGSLDFSSVMAKTYLREREKQMLAAGLEDHNVIASHYDETIRASRDKLERMNVEKLTRLEQKANLSDRSPIMTSASGGRSPLVERPTNVSSGPETADEGSDGRGAKRKAGLEHDQESLRSSVYYSADESSNQDPKRRSLDRFSIDRASLTGSVYYSADEGASVAGSIYYSATSGSEIEDHGVDDDEYLGAERPSAPGRPEAVDREGGILSELAYIKVETDALLLRWNPPETDGGTPITGYIIERCEGNSDFWVRVNLVPAKDTEYAVASLTGGRDYKFRVSAENAVGLSDPSEPSDPVTISGDVEATEPHLLKELRDVVAVQNQRVEFSVDIIATPKPDVTWFKDGFEIYDTTRYEFIADGDRYVLVVKSAELSDEGDIRVRATNKAGVTSSQASVVVQAPPRISLPGEYEQGLIFDTDELIRLRVPYMARPKPEAYWQHNGREIKPNDRYAMDVSEKYATLKIAGACRKDKGMYNLRLTNPQGSVATSFFVTVTDRPDPPGHPTVTDITGTSITLRWEPPQDDGGCRVSNYIVEYYRVGWDVWLKAASSRITWTQLGELIIGSEYKFRVKAENAYGVSEAGPESQPILIDDSKSPSGYADGANSFVVSCSSFVGAQGPVCAENGKEPSPKQLWDGRENTYERNEGGFFDYSQDTKQMYTVSKTETQQKFEQNFERRGDRRFEILMSKFRKKAKEKMYSLSDVEGSAMDIISGGGVQSEFNCQDYYKKQNTSNRSFLLNDSYCNNIWNGGDMKSLAFAEAISLYNPKMERYSENGSLKKPIVCKPPQERSASVSHVVKPVTGYTIKDNVASTQNTNHVVFGNQSENWAMPEVGTAGISSYSKPKNKGLLLCKEYNNHAISNEDIAIEDALCDNKTNKLTTEKDKLNQAFFLTPEETRAFSADVFEQSSPWNPQKYCEIGDPILDLENQENDEEVMGILGYRTEENVEESHLAQITAKTESPEFTGLDDLPTKEFNLSSKNTLLATSTIAENKPAEFITDLLSMDEGDEVQITDDQKKETTGWNTLEIQKTEKGKDEDLSQDVNTNSVKYLSPPCNSDIKKPLPISFRLLDRENLKYECTVKSVEERCVYPPSHDVSGVDDNAVGNHLNIGAQNTYIPDKVLHSSSTKMSPVLHENIYGKSFPHPSLVQPSEDGGRICPPVFLGMTIHVKERPLQCGTSNVNKTDNLYRRKTITMGDEIKLMGNHSVAKDRDHVRRDKAMSMVDPLDKGSHLHTILRDSPTSNQISEKQSTLGRSLAEPSRKIPEMNPENFFRPIACKEESLSPTSDITPEGSKESPRECKTNEEVMNENSYIRSFIQRICKNAESDGEKEDACPQKSLNPLPQMIGSVMTNYPVSTKSETIPLMTKSISHAGNRRHSSWNKRVSPYDVLDDSVKGDSLDSAHFSKISCSSKDSFTKTSTEGKKTWSQDSSFLNLKQSHRFPVDTSSDIPKSTDDVPQIHLGSIQDIGLRLSTNINGKVKQTSSSTSDSMNEDGNRILSLSSVQHLLHSSASKEHPRQSSPVTIPRQKKTLPSSKIHQPHDYDFPSFPLKASHRPYAFSSSVPERSTNYCTSHSLPLTSSIKREVSERINNLDNLMAQCLGNRDVTLNTISHEIPNISSLSLNNANDNLHMSCNELKKLLNDFNVMVNGLTSKLNMHTRRSSSP